MLLSYCNTDNWGTNPLCANPPATGTGRCVCSRVVPQTTRQEGNRVPCPGEDLSAPASLRCFFAPQPELEVCGGGVDEDDSESESVTNYSYNSLGQMVGAYKFKTTKWVNLLSGSDEFRLWQRNFYEHIIRHDREWEAIRQYIIANPQNWDHDRDNV